MPSAILLVDDRGRIVLANVQAEGLFGYPRTELVGTSVDSLLPERLRGPYAGLRRGYSADPRARAMASGRDLT